VFGSIKVVGYDAHLSYNIALCYYRLRDFAPALKHIADIIERGIRDHPELSVGMQTEGIEVNIYVISVAAYRQTKRGIKH
jgi:tetratricopeptide repeat protein 30